jgi:hypothetical protein
MPSLRMSGAIPQLSSKCFMACKEINNFYFPLKYVRQEGFKAVDFIATLGTGLCDFVYR